MTGRDAAVAAFGRRLVSTLRGAKGAAYHNQGINPAFGFDCLGAVVWAARDCGVAIEVVANWSPHGTGRELDKALRQYCGLVPFRQAQDGDLVVMGRGNVLHAGVVCLMPDGRRGVLHCDGKGLHESELTLDLPPGQGNATAPVKRCYRLKPDHLPSADLSAEAPAGA